MFEKLLSLMPYNPGLVHQMAFYSRRMREEAAIRRTGMIFLVIAFFIQFFAVMSPPQSTIANSDNDLITGGVSSAQDAKQHCLRDTRGFQRILHYYGISCSAFDNTASVTITNKGAPNYYSMGHNLSSGEDHPVTIAGAGKLYWRKLTTWQSPTFDTYRLRDQDGKLFYLIKDCGNLVSIGIPGANPLKVSGPISGSGIPQPSVNQGFTNTPTPTTPTTPPTVTPPPTKPCQYNNAIPADSPLCKPPCQYNSSLFADNPNCQPPCEYNSLFTANDPRCKPCDKSVSSADALACIDVRKTARNDTQGIADANNTTAAAGDTIIYNLFAENKGKATVKGFTFLENLSDVLDYADVVDLHGGFIDSNKNVTWPKQDINGGAIASVKITVRVKNPIPQTPASANDPNHFDLVMTNVYGNTVNIKLPGSPAKQVEVAGTALPNTGPGETLAVMAIVVILAGYFYSRATLLAKESQIAVREAVQA